MVVVSPHRTGRWSALNFFRSSPRSAKVVNEETSHHHCEQQQQQQQQIERQEEEKMVDYSDEEQPSERMTSGGAAKFPTPKFIFTISSPCIVTVARGDASPDMKDFTIRGALRSSRTSSTTSSTTSTGTTSRPWRPLKIKMSSLIIKMVNSMIEREMIAYEAVQILSSAGNIEVRILLDHFALSIIMDRCEQIGVGSVVGSCHAVPIETALLPPAGPPQKLVLTTTTATSPGAVVAPIVAGGPSSSTGSAVTVGAGAGAGAVGSALGSMLEDDECSYISEAYDVEDEKKEEDSSSSKTTEFSKHKSLSVGSDGGEQHEKHSHRVPQLLSSERKAQLQKQVATAREEWLKTASRVRVEQVVEEVYAGVALTLDYIAFTICAAMIAATGLVTDSGVSVLASMLVSPIMGPVLGITFGTTIRRKSLVLVSFRNEVVSLIICILVGMAMCVLSALWNVDERRDWPSSEMASRADPGGLIAGIFVAIPSGAAVALSTLGKNSSGLTGVAISLSLLPPAVNAGVCWMYGFMLLSPAFERNEGDDSDYFYMGGVSFGLTLINIACIWIAGCFMFWLKEVAPIRKKNAFWSQDVKIAREDGGRDVDTQKIEAGLEAVIELNKAAPPGQGLHKLHSVPELSSIQVGEARRQALAANAMEDAFFFGGSLGGGVSNEIAGGGALNDALPEKRRNAMTQSLAVAANKFGGIEGAGTALFDSTLYTKSTST